MRGHRVLCALSALFLAAAPCSSRALAAPSPRPAHPAAAILDHDDHMDANNLDMVVSNHGSLAYDIVTSNAGLVYPKGSGRTAVFAAGIWLGARVNGETRVALGEYAQEFAPGPMQNGTFIPDQISFHNFAFDATHPLSPTDLADYQIQGGPVDGSGNPVLFGDATIWSVFNDADPAFHANQAGSTAPLGVEVQQTVFAFNRAGPLSKAIFVKWKVINKGANRLDDAQLSIWSDPDLGGGADDLVGCDSTLDLGYCYNATNADLAYGSAPPAVGFTLLRGAVVSPSPGVLDTLGMTSFVKYIGGTDPASPEQTYHYLGGLNRDGTPMHVLNDPQLPETRYAVSGLAPGSPSGPANWLDFYPADRRLMVNTGPFIVEPGASQDILFAICVGQGTDRLSSIVDLRNVVHAARAFSPPLPPVELTADLTLEPASIDLATHARWLVAVVEPSGFDPAAIDLGSVLLSGAAADPGFAEIADHDADGLPDLMLRFPRAALEPILVPGVVRLELTGTLVTGGPFSGADDVRVIDPPRAGLAASVAPNPLNPTGTLRFRTTRAGSARVRVFDSRGRWIRTLLEDPALPAGWHEVVVEGHGARGERLGSGVYWFRIDASEGRAAGRFALLK